MIKLTDAGLPAYKKLETIYSYLRTYLSTCNKVTNSMTSDRVFELGNRTANIKNDLNSYKNDADLIRYAQEEADNNPEYEIGYDVVADFQDIFASFNTILAAVQALDKSLALTMDAKGRRVWQTMDTSTLVTAVAEFQAVVSFG